jgi:hypothetical protein
MSILLWIQFSLFYLISAPLNVACYSADDIINFDYSLTSSGNASGVMAVFNDLKFNPGMFLDDCRAGEILFKARINTEGKSIAKFMRDASETFFDKAGLGSTVDKNSLKSMIKLPDFNSSTSDVKSVDLKAFNTSSLNIPQLNLNVSFVSVATNVNNTLYALTPQSFDSNLGNQASAQTAITDFNNLVQSHVPSFAGWTFDYIATNYVATNTAFNVR